MAISDVLRDLTENVRNQVGFDRDENHIRAADHLRVRVSDRNPEFLEPKSQKCYLPLEILDISAAAHNSEERIWACFPGGGNQIPESVPGSG